MSLAGTQILTVNQVFAILLDFLDQGNWADAFERAIPGRKKGQTQPESAASDEQTPQQPADSVTEAAAPADHTAAQTEPDEAAQTEPAK